MAYGGQQVAASFADVVGQGRVASVKVAHLVGTGASEDRHRRVLLAVYVLASEVVVGDVVAGAKQIAGCVARVSGYGLATLATGAAATMAGSTFWTKWWAMPLKPSIDIVYIGRGWSASCEHQVVDEQGSVRPENISLSCTSRAGVSPSARLAGSLLKTVVFVNRSQRLHGQAWPSRAQAADHRGLWDRSNGTRTNRSDSYSLRLTGRSAWRPPGAWSTVRLAPRLPGAAAS